MKTFKLDEQPKIKPGFTVPEGYFDAFQHQVMARIEREHTTKVIPLYRRRVWISAAAAIAVMALAIPFANSYRQQPESPDAVALENYLHKEAGLSQYDLIGLLDQEDIRALEADAASSMEDKAMEEALSANGNLENYLVN